MESDGSVWVPGRLRLRAPADPTLCGRVKALLVVDATDTVKERYEWNNVAAYPVSLLCGKNGTLIGFSLEL